MTYAEADIPLQAPRLLQLSASVVAAHSITLLAHAKSVVNEQSNQYHSQREQERCNAGIDTAAVFQFPLPASNAVFESLREQWIKTVSICFCVIYAEIYLLYFSKWYLKPSLLSFC